MPCFCSLFQGFLALRNCRHYLYYRQNPTPAIRKSEVFSWGAVQGSTRRLLLERSCVSPFSAPCGEPLSTTPTPAATSDVVISDLGRADQCRGLNTLILLGTKVSMGSKITIQYHGIVASVGDWARLLGIDYYTLLARLRRGWSAEAALERPVHHNGGGKRTHRKTGSKEYRAWLAMRERCSCPRYWAYDRYGQRGISVSPLWQSSFETFFQDVGPAPSPQHSLGRLNNDGNYEPGNVAWQTVAEQSKNRAAPRRRSGTPRARANSGLTGQLPKMCNLNCENRNNLLCQ